MIEIFLFPYTIFKYGIGLMFWSTIIAFAYYIVKGHYSLEFHSPIVFKNKVSTDDVRDD